MADPLQIRRIAYGETIREPGIYDMPISWYHANCCDGPSVSSSGLRTIILQTPEHYWDTSYLNPLRDPDAKNELEADHFRMGRAAHWRMLEPERFMANVAVRPGMWDSWRTKDSQRWAKDAQREGMTVLTPAELDRVDGIAAAFKRHPRHQEGLLGGVVEASLIVKDARTGIWIKSRPDSIPIDDAFSDLKVMNDASPEAVDRAIRSLGYDMQMALAGIAFEKLTGRTVDQFWVVAVESSRPHAIHVASISTERVYWSRLRLRQGLDLMAKCLKENYWPAWGRDGEAVGLTKWETDAVNAMKGVDDEF